VPASKVGGELLFDVIATAYERTSTIVTASPTAVGSSRPTANVLSFSMIARCWIG
jgi:hypothetical protein